MTFEDGGRKIGKLIREGKTNRTGSTVTFLPDSKIFKNCTFSFSKICERAQEDAFLLKGLKMIVTDLRKEKRENVYQYEDGLKAFIEEINSDHTPMHDPVSFSGEYNSIKVEGVCAKLYKLNEVEFQVYIKDLADAGYIRIELHNNIEYYFATNKSNEFLKSKKPQELIKSCIGLITESAVKGITSACLEKVIA